MTISIDSGASSITGVFDDDFGPTLQPQPQPETCNGAMTANPLLSGSHCTATLYSLRTKTSHCATNYGRTQSFGRSRKWGFFFNNDQLIHVRCLLVV